jgi:hypothetical protein
MPYQDSFILMGVGGLFVVLGLALILWGKREEKSYYDSLSTRRTDLREFVGHWPQRIEPKALKTGGWVAVIIGLAILVAGGAFWLWAKTGG